MKGRLPVNEYMMLSLAAKAAGVHWSMWDWARLNSVDSPISRDMLWNPIANDGETARLAAHLKIATEWNADGSVTVRCAGATLIQPQDPVGGICSQWRLAVVRLAAEIGKAMP